MGPGDLSRVLAPLPKERDPRLLVGHETFDDAGIVLLSDELALVQTVDFFAPIVDDPYSFGQVAAANALSDIYAMGGEPLTALNIVGFPVDKLPLEVLTDILRGGQSKVREAGGLIVGGHTVVDDEIKYGLSVTGRVHPKRILSNANAVAGDRLILTKSLGSGILATALKRDDAALPPNAAIALVGVMATLNRAASIAAIAVGARCATDVTGFGLLGHASHIARASGVTLQLEIARIPLMPGAVAAWQRGARTGGAERNLAFVEGAVSWGRADEAMRALLIDPQTSGGLLVAVPAARAANYLSRVEGAVEVGEVAPGSASLIVLV